MERTTLSLNIKHGVLLIDIHDDDSGTVWITEPDTGVRVGIGRLEDDHRTPFVCINTEMATDEPRQDTNAPGEPILAVDLNDAPLYGVTVEGIDSDSMCHVAQRVQRKAAKKARKAARRAEQAGL